MWTKCAKIRTFFENCTFLIWAIRRRHRCRDCMHFYQMQGRKYGFCDRAGEPSLLAWGSWPRRRAGHLPCLGWLPFFPPKRGTPRPQGAPGAAGEVTP